MVRGSSGPAEVHVIGRPGRVLRLLPSYYAQSKEIFCSIGLLTYTSCVTIFLWVGDFVSPSQKIVAGTEPLLRTNPCKQVATKPSPR